LHKESSQGKGEGVICKRESVADSIEMIVGEADQWARQYWGMGSNTRKVNYTWGSEAWKVLRVQVTI